MLELPRRVLYHAWVGYWNIGYKKRIAIQVVFVLVLISFIARPLFIANLSELSFFREKGANGSDILWEKWAHNAGYKYFKAIGDIYDICEGKRKAKSGKVFVYFDEKEQVAKAVVVANFTMSANFDTGTVHVVAKYHGRLMYDRKHDLCRVDVDSFKCPMKKGDVIIIGQDMRIYETFKLPKYIPKGRYLSTATAYNQDSKCVLTAESDFKV